MASSSSGPPTAVSSPYSPENILKLRSHIPCQPFGDGWYKAPFNTDHAYCDPAIISKSTPEDFVFAKECRDRDPTSPVPPFAQTYFDAGSQQHSISLRILEVKAGGRAKGAQVVLCEVQRAPTEYWKAMGWTDSHFPNKVIAKIFDPLCYPKITPYGGERLDIVSWADKQYAHEAAAYIEIHGHRHEHPIVDDVTANFFGTFTMPLESPASDNHPHRLRQVRVVLLEYIDGTPISELCKRRRPDLLIPTERAGNVDERLKVFARILRGIVAMEKVGVFHDDPDPSNILLVDKKGGKRVVITDFNQSRVERYTRSGRHLAQNLPRPLHPRWRFGITGFECLAGWFPYEWLDYVEPYRRGPDDSDTDSDGEEDDGPGRSFTKWAMKTFDEKDFVLADEADVFAEQWYAEREQREKQSTETTQMQTV